MNSSPVMVEESGSKRDLAAALLEEPWFSEEPVSSRRPSSRPPPSGIVRVGEFLGDPEVDSWLR